jgi:hypothetical protein
MTFQPSNSKTVFLATSEVFPQDQSQFLVKLTSTYTDIAQCVNVREIATYQDNQAVITGQQFSTPGNTQLKKYTFRKVYYFGAILAGATLTVAHGITGLVQFTSMYGTCVTAIVDYRPIPFVSTAAVNQQISLNADGTNFYVINGAASPNITSGIIVLQYLLN